MSARYRALRRRTSLAVAVATAATGIAAYSGNAFESLELQTVDLRFEVPGRPPTSKDIVIVGIDDITFQDLDLQWPLPRSRHARVIERLKDDGAAVIAYDVQFTEPTSYREDSALFNAVKANGPVVLSTTETRDDGGTNVLGGDDVVSEARARAANTLFDAASDGTIRQVAHTLRRLETFAVATAEVRDGRQVGRQRFTEPNGRAWIDFAGGPGAIPTVPFSRVLSGRFKTGTFKGRIVVVGATAPALKDVHATSTTTTAALMSGPEVQANAIATVRAGLPLQSSPTWLSIVVILLLSVAVPLGTLRVRAAWILLLGVGVGLAYGAAAAGLFWSGTVVPVAIPLLALLISTVGSTAGYTLLTAFERQRTRDLFARFVPAAVVDDVLAKADGDLRLGGQRKEGTVMFCDLRGFTTFAERLEPDRVIDVLNQYLSEMSDAIMDEGGTLVAYMGDGIMAVFGAPLDRADHADRAVAAAREMIEVRLPRFNAWIADQGLGHEFRMGIGVNSGPVMSGNVGSAVRVEYTAIGDTTNTAARIESMTKDEDTQVLLSEATRLALVDEAARAGLQHVGERAVRGRDQTISLWTIGRTVSIPLESEKKSSFGRSQNAAYTLLRGAAFRVAPSPTEEAECQLLTSVPGGAPHSPRSSPPERPPAELPSFRR